MNDETKLGQSIGGAVVSLSGAVLAWVATHISAIGTVIAICAGLFSVWASVETALTRRKQRRQRRNGDDDQDPPMD